MNYSEEKKAKKLGEVLAFAGVGIDTLEKGKEGFLKSWDETKINKLIEINKSHQKKLESVIESLETREIGMKKADATSEKLSKMRDMYIGDEWDDNIELFEWSGFFEGAAIVHWSLIKGAAEGNEELKSLVEEADKYHRDLFEEVNESIIKAVN
ncbi:MAG: hypothetical protein WDZ80_05370 [Candidatus Paceibacterota bacterium]